MEIVKESDICPQEITKAQRLCLLHVLRNAAAAINGTIRLVEDERYSPTFVSLVSCLEGAPETLERTVKALKYETFCPLIQEECSFVGKHVGCDRKCPMRGGAEFVITKEVIPSGDYVEIQSCAKTTKPYGSHR